MEKDQDKQQRCDWVTSDPLYRDYHDKEWGVPQYDSQVLFERLSLEIFQSGLSWITILKKRDNFRCAFDSFSPQKIANYTPKDIMRLLQDKGIVRNKAKILATIANAKAWLGLEELDGFSNFIWEHVEGKPIKNHYSLSSKRPTKIPLSQKLALNLKKSGFTFCGPVNCYAFMQSAGLVNDHETTCFRYPHINIL